MHPSIPLLSFLHIYRSSSVWLGDPSNNDINLPVTLAAATEQLSQLKHSLPNDAEKCALKLSFFFQGWRVGGVQLHSRGREKAVGPGRAKGYWVQEGCTCNNISFSAFTFTLCSHSGGRLQSVIVTEKLYVTCVNIQFFRTLVRFIM